MTIDEFKARLWMWGPFILFGLVFAGLVWYALQFEFEASDNEQNSGEVPSDPLYQLTELEDLRQAYLAANGGRESLEALQSVRTRGVLETGGKQVPFLSIKKRPWQSLLTLRYPAYELSFVVDGDVVWQRLTMRGQEPVTMQSTGEEAADLKQLGAFFDSVMRLFLFQTGTVHGITEGVWDGQTAVVVEFEDGESAIKSKAFINPANMHLLARKDDLAEDGQRTLLYSDYKTISGVLVPFTVKTIVNGALETQLTLENIDYNIGTFPLFFQFPGNSGEDTVDAPALDAAIE